MNLAELARRNFSALAANEYPGRIILGGTMDNSHTVQGLIITVRSAPNQNRALVADPDPNPNGRVKTIFADQAAAAGVDPTNILYLAMSHSGRFFMTTNGQHTQVVHSIHHDLASSLMQAGWGHEEDSANTARVGVFNRFEDVVHTEFAVLKLSPFDNGTFASNFYVGNIPPCFAFYISTYRENGNPPPPFEGEPRLIPLIGTSLAEVAANLWKAMNPDYFVSIALKEINPVTLESHIHIVNAREIIAAQP